MSRLSNPHFVAINEDYAALDIVTYQSVSITVVPLNEASASVFAHAVAQASNMYDHWWVSRVLVRKPEARGGGLGSMALQRMLSCIAKQSDLPVRVAPGGYSADTEKQFNFYRKNGFEPVEGESGLLQWRAS